MIKRWLARRSARLVVLVVVVGGVAAGVAYATGAIPGANGTIQGCYDTGGNLKVVASLPCPHGYTALAWSQTGPAGKDGTNGTNGKDGTNGTNGTNGAPGAPGKDGTNGTNGTNGKDGAQGVPGPTSLDALNGSPCTFDGHASTTQVTVDSTTGAVSIVCNPVYKVSLTITTGSMTFVNLRDQTTADNNLFNSASGTISAFFQKGHEVVIEAESGTHQNGGGTEFHLFCPPNDEPEGAIGLPSDNGATYYSGECDATVDSDLTSTAIFH